MKTPSRDLYELIRSLDRNEKRYFVLQGGKGDKKYLQLFHGLDRERPPDERKLRRQLQLSPGNFKKLKHYTQDSVLRSLENFHSAASEDIIISRYLTRAEILFRKKNYKLAERAVRQALRFAEERDRILFLIPCYEWLYKIGYFSGESAKGLSWVDPVRVRDAARASERWMILHRENLRFWDLIKRAQVIGRAEKKELRDIIRICKKVLASGPAGMTLKKEAYINLALATRYTGEWKKSYEWRSKLVELMESRPALLNENAPAYIVAIGNLMNACREMGREGEMKKLVEKARIFMGRLPQKYVTLQVEDRYINLLNSRLLWDFKKKEFEAVKVQGSVLVRSLRKHPQAWGNSMQVLLYQSLMFSSAYTGDHRAANRHYQSWLKVCGESEVTRRLTGLVLLCEARDFELVYHRGRSLLSWLERKTNMGSPLKELAKVFVNDFGKVTNRRELKAALQRLSRVMKTFHKQIYRHLDPEVLDLEAWIRRQNNILER